MTKRAILTPTVTAENGREFSCMPAAILVFVIDSEENILLLRHPDREGWEVINGALEAGETVLEGALRESREEAGTAVRAVINTR